jgi:hypothetical protein
MNKMKGFWLFFSIGAIMSTLFSSGQVENPDTHLRLTQTRIFSENFTLGLPTDVGEESHGNIAVNTSGSRHMVYNPGQSLFFLPVYYFAQTLSNNDGERYYTAAFIVSFINFFIHAFCAWLLFNIALSLKASTKKSLFVALVFCLTSYSFSFAQSTYEHHFEMFFILLAYYFIISNNLNRNAKYAGIAIALGLLFRSTTILAVPGILILVSSNRQRLYFLLYLLPGVLVILLYNYFRFGNFLESGYNLAWQSTIGNDESIWSLNRVPRSAFGFLFSPGKGLLIFSPTILIGLWGAKKFLIKYQELSVSVAMLCAFYLFLFSMNFAWHGSIWAFGPRYILPLLPFLYLPLTQLKLRKWIYPLLFVSALGQVLFISVNYKRDVLEQHIRLNGVTQERYIHSLANIPYIAQGRQLAKILPKTISGKLRNYQPNSPWKKEVRTGSNQEVLDSSIEKNALNFWWVRVFLWESSILQKSLTLLTLLIAIIGVFFTISYVKKIT